jgi:uncharacterized lipoprotein YajG
MLHPAKIDEQLERRESAMKTLLICLFFLAGCTNVPKQTTETIPTPEPGQSTYTADQMRKTGRQTAAGALEELDPEVTVRHDGH